MLVCHLYPKRRTTFWRGDLYKSNSIVQQVARAIKSNDKVLTEIHLNPVA